MRVGVDAHTTVCIDKVKDVDVLSAQFVDTLWEQYALSDEVGTTRRLTTSGLLTNTDDATQGLQRPCRGGTVYSTPLILTVTAGGLRQLTREYLRV